MIKSLLKNTHKKIQKEANKKESRIQKPFVFLLSFLRPVYYSNEWLLINGIKRKSRSKQQSIIFFSVHKSASTFIKNTIFELIGKHNLTLLNLSGYLTEAKQKELYNNPLKMDKLLQEKGYFYGAFRKYYNFPKLDKFKILLVLRDPRDVLTSRYFSVLYNHPLSRKEVYKRRKKYEGISIDDFVLEYAPGIQKIYEDYCLNLIDKENVLFLKYEDMITDLRPWLTRLSVFFNLSGNENLIEEIVNKTSFKVKKEDPHSFIRNIKAGDHKNKLRAETIETLNGLFRNELKLLNYID